jgi:hypothetical protein
MKISTAGGEYEIAIKRDAIEHIINNRSSKSYFA